MRLLPACVMLLWLVPAGADDKKNPWIEKLETPLSEARRDPNPDSLLAALDAAWRADDVAAQTELVDLALARAGESERLRGPIVRALWRTGRIEEAEKLAAKITDDSSDPIAVSALINIESSRGNLSRALKLAERIPSLKNATASDRLAAISTEIMADKFSGLADRIRAVGKDIDPANGYPEIFLAEVIDGLPDFVSRVGDEPLNQLRAYGSAPMPLMSLVTLPVVDAYINGTGPHRLIVDTGGSMALSLHNELADELGIKPLAGSTIRGVSGKQEAKLAVTDELRIGDIEVRRAMTTTFSLPPPLNTMIAGILGTGLFSKGRMTLHFKEGRIEVSPSSDKPASGDEQTIRLVGDAKMLAPVRVQGERHWAIIDSGAELIALSPKHIRRWFPERKPLRLQGAGLGVGQGDSAGLEIVPGVSLEALGATRSNIGGLALDALDTTLSPFVGVESAVLIGMPLLRETESFTVDFPKCRLWVKWLDAK